MAPVDFAGQPADLAALRARWPGARGLAASSRTPPTRSAPRPAAGRSARSADLRSSASTRSSTSRPARAAWSPPTTPSWPRAAAPLPQPRHRHRRPPSGRPAAALWHYEMVDLGFNYRLTDIQCALGLSQLPKLEQFLAAPRGDRRAVPGGAEGPPGLTIPRVAPDVRHAWHIFPVLVEPSRLRVGRDEVFAALRAEGIGVTCTTCRPTGIRTTSAWATRAGCARSRRTRPRACFSLPIFPGMTGADVEDVVAALWKVLGYYRT